MDYFNYDDHSDQGEDVNSSLHECVLDICYFFMPPHYLKSSMRQIAKIGQSLAFSMLKCISLKKVHHSCDKYQLRPLHAGQAWQEKGGGSF